MGFFSSLKQGFSDFVDHRIIGKKTVTVDNPSMTDAERIKADSAVDVAKIERDAKFRLAEMEQENKIRLAEMDSERQEEWRAAQLEIIQAQTLAQMAIDKARLDGMTAVAEQFVALQKTMLDVATKRIAIIETASLPIIKDIERHYDEIGEKISAARDKYNREELPQLLVLLGQFEAGSDMRTLFMQRVQDDMKEQNHFIITQIDAVKEQQNSVLQSFLASKLKTSEQLDQLLTQITAEITATLPQGQSSVQALPGADTKALPPAK